MKEFLQRCKKYFVYCAFLSCFINLLGLTFTFYMYSIYDLICTSFSESSLHTITIIALYCLIMLGMFLYVRHRVLSVIGFRLDKTLSSSVLKNTIYLSSGPRKDLYTRGISDLWTLRDYFSHQGMFAIFDLPWAPFYLILVFCIHKVLGIATMLAALIILLLSVLQEKLCQDLIISANKLNHRNLSFENSIYRNSEAILSMSMIKPVISKWKNKNNEVIVKQTTASTRAGVIHSILTGLQVLLPVAVFGLGAYFVIKREISAGFIIVASILEGQATRPLIRLMYSYKQTISAWEAYNRLNRFLFFWEKSMFAKKKRSLRLPKPKGNLTVENVYFALFGKIILKNITFSLSKGEFLGIIGPTGAGKTTLAKLLCGIWQPLFGSIRLDGYDISKWDKESLGKYIGYLPQEVILFPGTVMENIAGFNEIDEKRIKEIAEELDLKFIEELPNSYDTFIDRENTNLLSGGQKQKIGFVRAIYNNPALLILDEPNSNLDEISEQRLISYLMKLRQKRELTCIIISHTPKILSIVDKILVLGNGMKVDFGPRDLVLKKLLSNKAFVQKKVAHA